MKTKKSKKKLTLKIIKKWRGRAKLPAKIGVDEYIDMLRGKP